MCSRGDANFYPSYLETGFCFWQLLTALSIRILDFERLKSNYRFICYAFVLMYTITQDDITNCFVELLDLAVDLTQRPLDGVSSRLIKGKDPPQPFCFLALGVDTKRCSRFHSGEIFSGKAEFLISQNHVVYSHTIIT